MEEQSIFERHQIKAKEIFEQATFQEFFGNHLFEPREVDYYLFASGESGNAVWLSRNLEPMMVDEASKIGPHPVIPQTHTIHHCEPIDGTLFQDKRFSDIEAKIKQGGKSLGQKANKAFVDVLNAAISNENCIKASGHKLDETLADLFSQQAQAGFPPDTFLFPKYLEAKLIQAGIIIRDKEIPNLHYVGQTISGQRAFWSENMPNATILMFDSRSGIALTKKPRFETIERIQAFTPAVCGYLELNPVVKNTQSVIAVNNIDEVLTRPTSSIEMTQTTTPVTYVDTSRINELKALTSSKFDLTKLIRLCEELNICYTHQSYLAVAMLTRAVLDHVPPIFGYDTFVEVANNCGGRSLKKSLQNLQNSSRNISDAYLHLPIRDKETLPNRTQVDFSNDMDVLLAEVIRILK